jgi:5S rRNA maturation endonuclease (ribonuclease M5)
MALNFSAGSTAPLSKKVSLGKNLKMPGYESFTEVEKDYLERRGFFIPEVKRKFGIRGGGIAGEWSYRILIPIFYNGRLVSWTGRSILPKDILTQDNIPRYKNLSVEKSEINPKEIFFNLDNSRNDSVILVEGPFDVLKMGNDTICSLGTSVTSAQKLLLLKRYKKVFIAFDNEPAAQEKAKVLGKDLNSIGLEVEVVNICEDYGKNDPGELVKKEVAEIKKELGLFDEKEYDDVFQEDLR